MTRRRLLATTAAGLLAGGRAGAATIAGELPWRATPLPKLETLDPARLDFLTPEEADMLGVLADRIIPADELSPGGREMGCVVFIDRQLAGPYGAAGGWYMRPPFVDPLPTQGEQWPLTPAQRYRQGLAALAEHMRLAFAGRPLREVPGERVDAMLAGMESGALALPGVNAKGFAELVIRDVKQGFFADPGYGGNKGMAAWTMVGFPGARYDYRDWIGRHGQRYTLPPVSLAGRRAWVEGR